MRAPPSRLRNRTRHRRRSGASPLAYSSRPLRRPSLRARRSARGAERLRTRAARVRSSTSEAGAQPT
eukprot:3335986-Alexandrium_andersonii.AAC.1